MLAQVSEEGAGDDDALNLVGAFEDLCYLYVAHVALDRVVAYVTGSAEDLYGVCGYFHACVGGDTPGHGCLPAGALSCVEPVGGVVDEEAGGFNFHGHVG